MFEFSHKTRSSRRDLKSLSEFTVLLSSVKVLVVKETSGGNRHDVKNEDFVTKVYHDLCFYLFRFGGTLWSKVFFS